MDGLFGCKIDENVSLGGTSGPYGIALTGCSDYLLANPGAIVTPVRASAELGHLPGAVRAAMGAKPMKKFTSLQLALFLGIWSGSSSSIAQTVHEATSTGEISGDKESLTWNGAITNRTTNRRTSTICQFMSGPKAHGWHDFAPFPPAPIDSTCDDGAGSVGIVQPTGHGDRY
jgi:hypothetical protein